MSKGMSGHQSARMVTDTWITPKYIIDDLGPFDLDPCTPPEMPWKTAGRMLTKKDDGLKSEWSGSIWMNPPYGREMEKWLEKLSHHDNGIALIFARTETKAFINHVWEKATSILFIYGRLYFHKPDGTKAKGNSGAPSCLVAYGVESDEKIRKSEIKGKYIRLK